MDNTPPLPPISELARPELKLGGLRIDPEQNSRSRMSYVLGLNLVPVTDQLMLPASADSPSPPKSITGIPEGAWMNLVSWSPDSKHVAFTVRSAGGPSDPARGPLTLYVANVSTGVARPVLSDLNVVFEDYVWINPTTIVATTIPVGRGDPPIKAPTPLGPKIQCNVEGETAQARTYQDLLKNTHDEALFDYYGTSVPVSVDIQNNQVTPLGEPGVYTGLQASPDGKYLIVSTLKRPYSYLVPCGRFPKKVELWRADNGEVLRTLADLPLAESIPIAVNSVRQGPRRFSWRPDVPSCLVWGECQDGGDPTVPASPRDIIYTLEATQLTQAPRVLTTTELRWGSLAWCDDNLAIVTESEYKTRRSVWSTFAPADATQGLPAKQVLFDRNYEDVYTDPGSPMTRKTKFDTSVLLTLEADGDRKLVFTGLGATPEGYRPFLETRSLTTGDVERLWTCEGKKFEQLGTLLNDKPDVTYTSLHGLDMFLTRETPEEPAQYHWVSWSTRDAWPSGGGVGVGVKGGVVHEREEKGEEEEEKESVNTVSRSPGSPMLMEPRRFTNFPHPYPQLKGHTKEILKYEREDGVELNGTLYLPPGWKRGDAPLPTIIWAYPREFKSKAAAGQMRKSPYMFSWIGSLSPTLWLARGYAVLDGPSMPVVGDGDAEPNDTYVVQLTASARAAVDALCREGVADRGRIAVGGHSYGAFMTANLLAHCGDLFACGIARSGAYNRTLTPFGFQAEERTIWQAPETYARMSPFMHADQIKKPILLIHGDEDANPGTHTLQSERFYQALKGHGAPCRLVLLPHESHGYNARESVMHTLYEQDAWLSRFCSGEQAANGHKV